jgi:DedD protein
MKKIHKHRLALLLGVLIALVFFYLGVNKWIESQESFVSTPPTIVRAKEPVQIKEETQQVTVETEEVEEATGEVTVEIATVSAVQNEPQETPAQSPQPKEEVKEEPKREPSPGTKPDSELRKEEVVVEEEPKIIIKKAEKEFVVQIGAFKNQENAQKTKEKASQNGFESFIVVEDGLFKVRVRVLAGSVSEALGTVRSQFGNAFIVK